MIIVWGKKAVANNIGRVADYCPVCRAPQEFDLNRIRMGPHLYGVTVGAGAGDLLATMVQCRKCGLEIFKNSEPYIRHVENFQAKKMDFNELVAVTNPDLMSTCNGRIELESNIRKEPLKIPPETRTSYIDEAFSVLSNMTQWECRSIKVDLVLFVSFLAIPVIPLMSSRILDSFGVGGVAHINIVFGIIFVCIANMIVQSFLFPKRYVKKRIVPILNEWISPILPNKEELSAAFASLKSTKGKLANNLAISDLKNIGKG